MLRVAQLSTSTLCQALNVPMFNQLKKAHVSVDEVHYVTPISRSYLHQLLVMYYEVIKRTFKDPHLCNFAT